MNDLSDWLMVAACFAGGPVFSQLILLLAGLAWELVVWAQRRLMGLPRLPEEVPDAKLIANAITALKEALQTDNR